MKSVIQLSPAEFMQGFKTGIFTGKELIPRDDILTTALREYTGNVSPSGHLSILLSINVATLTIDASVPQYVTLVNGLIQSSFLNSNTDDIVALLFDNYFHSHLLRPQVNTPHQLLLDILLPIILSTIKYKSANPGLLNQH